MHLGNARTALVAWLSVRSRGGMLVWRVEDLDGPRSVPGRAAEQARELAWLGLDWDDGPWRGELGRSSAAPAEWWDEPWEESPGPEWWQSRRSARYAAALRRLEGQGRLFPCALSRRDLQQIASAPHGSVSGACGVSLRAAEYPADLRPTAVEPGWLERLLADETAAGEAGDSVRLRVEDEEICWHDLLYGRRCENLAETCGDFVLRRRDGVWSYQLAVVVDDAEQEVDEVVRGADLLDSTARQIWLQRCLGAPTPRYGHVPLLVGNDGEKLNKRDAALELAALRRSGVEASAIVGYLACTLGLRPEATPARPTELIAGFSWQRLRREPAVVPDDVATRLRHG
ncbi:MAG: tRNA glutamyl-Q(34) synthetase GluQRS [Acidobacteria bacterium]|nr:MAG: tRNA glutamyl-Q(34) synthetase GluQRS [Acidobacteriota bacterium]